MKRKTLLQMCLVSFFLLTPAEGQDVISFDPRGLVLGVDLGAATYDGDAAAAFDRMNTGFGFEAYYNLAHRLSVGVSFSTSRYGVFDQSRNSLGVGVRMRMFRDRVSPYVGLGAHIVNGGEKTGLGPSASLGIEFATSDRVAFFIEGSWSASIPDEAVDELDGDAGIDHLLGVGAGARFRLTQPKNPRFAVEIDSPDTVLVGDLSVLRARVTGNPSSEVYLAWELDQVASYRGPEVRHVFNYLGPQTVTVSGRNERYEVRASTQIVVVEDEIYRNPDDPLLASQPSTEGRVRIIEIYGSRTAAVGEALNYRARLQPGSLWPVNYYWDMGDGNTQMGNNVLQRFDRPGSYTITVIARNSRSADTLTTQVEVRPRNGQPTGQADVAEEPPQEESTANVRRVRYSPDELHGLRTVSPSQGGYGWVVGTYLDMESAEQLMRKFRVKGFRTGVVIDSRSGVSTAYRVVVGQFASTARALSAKREVQRLIATPISILDIANPSVTVGARSPQERRDVQHTDVPPTAPAAAEEARAAVDRTPADTQQQESSIQTRSSLPGDLPQQTIGAAATSMQEESPLRSGVDGPQIQSLKVYVRDERLLLFLDGVADREHGIARVEYRVFSATDEPLSSWSEVSLVPPGRSSYGLQMHRVPVPQGLTTAGGGVEVRAVNQAGGFTTISASIGAE